MQEIGDSARRFFGVLLPDCADTCVRVPAVDQNAVNRLGSLKRLDGADKRMPFDDVSRIYSCGHSRSVRYD